MSVPGHGRELVDGINATDKSFFCHLIETVKLPDSKGYARHMVIQYSTSTADVSLAGEFQK